MLSIEIIGVGGMRQWWLRSSLILACAWSTGCTPSVMSADDRADFLGTLYEPSLDTQGLKAEPPLPPGPCPIPDEEIITIDELGNTSVECPSVRRPAPEIEAGPSCTVQQDEHGHTWIT